MPELTDAEKLAAAEAAMAEAVEAAKAARLPSATAAVAFLGGETAQTFLTALKAAAAANIDDLPRPMGTPGAEGTKQMLDRIIISFESGLSAAQTRVTALQPAAPPTEPVTAPSPA